MIVITNTTIIPELKLKLNMVMFLITPKETSIGYRGSKTVIGTDGVITVKEQRVYDSWPKINSNYFGLRFTLTDCVSSYQIRIQSKQINIQIKRFYSSAPKINPWFITGFVDGEGCFLISVDRNKELKIGWTVQLTFQIGLHYKDKALLEEIKNFFGVGNITKQGPESFQYRVSSIKDLVVIINHFKNYPLITQKCADFEVWKKAFYLVQNREHLTEEGLTEIVEIKSSLNLGLSPQLKEYFSEIVLAQRPRPPLDSNQKILDPFWLAGFTSAEGCFFINLHKVTDRKLNERVKLGFKLTQHSRDEQLMNNLIEFLGCGNLFRKVMLLIWLLPNFQI